MQTHQVADVPLGQLPPRALGVDGLELLRRVRTRVDEDRGAAAGVELVELCGVVHLAQGGASDAAEGACILRRTLPETTIQQSCSLLCLATSVMENLLPLEGAAAAGASAGAGAGATVTAGAATIAPGGAAGAGCAEEDA